MTIQTTLVSAHNEWDEMEELIVGTPRYARIPTKDAGYLATSSSATDLLSIDIEGAFPKQIIEETEEDIDIFIAELVKLGITVRRPTAAHIKQFTTPDWTCDAYFPYCPRDIFSVIGNTIIESPNVLRSRYFEAIHYKDLLIEYMKSGAKWLSAPKPRLLEAGYNTTNKKKLSLNNIEPVFDAANIIRAGRDIFFLISDTGNSLGLQWLQNTLGPDYKVHTIPPEVYSSMHIDSTLCFLRPGLLLANPARVNRSNLPKILQKWDILYAPEMVEYQYSNLKPMSSKWLGMNLLMLSPTRAVVDAHQTPLIKLLEHHHIDVLPIQLRHGHVLGGGLHCITLDIRRKGTLESYF